MTGEPQRHETISQTVTRIAFERGIKFEPTADIARVIIDAVEYWIGREREECAKVCDEWAGVGLDKYSTQTAEYVVGTIGQIIRARSATSPKEKP